MKKWHENGAMKISRLLLIVVLVFSLVSCLKKTITISNVGQISVNTHAKLELEKYLSEIYTDVEFSFVDVNSQADIKLLLTE